LCPALQSPIIQYDLAGDSRAAAAEADFLIMVDERGSEMNSKRTGSIFSGRTAVLIALAACTITASAEQPDDKGRNVLFSHRDLSVEYHVTQFAGQIPVLGHGVQVGTAQGAVTGSTITAFTFIGPIAESRVGITDLDGDRILFRKSSVGQFVAPINDPTTSNPLLNVFGGGGLVLAGTYEVIGSTGKYTKRFRPGDKFPFRSVTSAPGIPQPATPPLVGQIPMGTEYVEVYSN
jgi:hypothetical protein